MAGVSARAVEVPDAAVAGGDHVVVVPFSEVSLLGCGQFKGNLRHFSRGATCETTLFNMVTS